MTCGIYSILNKANGKIYVGQSVDVQRRFSEHKKHLRKNRVSKSIEPTCKQGFIWRYIYYDENDTKKSINSVDLVKLKDKVISHGLEWREL